MGLRDPKESTLYPSPSHSLGAAVALLRSRCSASSRETTAFSAWKPPCCISSHSSPGNRPLCAAPAVSGVKDWQQYC